MRRASLEFGSWLWPAALLALGTVVAGLGCGAPVEPDAKSPEVASAVAIACPIDPRTGQAVVGCDGGVAPDAGRDAGPDGGPRDGGPDGGPRDGGPDGGPHDGGQDGGPDGGPRDGGPPDGGRDGGPDAGPDGGVCDGGAAASFGAEAAQAADPNACKWPAPTHTSTPIPTNFILDLGMLNVVGRFNETYTHDTDICRDDRAQNGSGYIQGCLRATAAPVGQCLSGSAKHSEENGSCNTPDCACPGDDGTCKAPGCSLAKDDQTYGGGGGWNVRGGDNLPIIGRFMPTAKGNPFRINFNLIGQFGGGVSTDKREGSSPCFGCCANGNTRFDDTLHGNLEVKLTGFMTFRVWSLCATATVNGAFCAQVDRINQLQCDNTQTSSNKARALVSANWGNFYFGYCPGQTDDDKRNFRGGACTYDPATSSYKCGWGWASFTVPWVPSSSWDVFGNGATQDICLF